MSSNSSMEFPVCPDCGEPLDRHCEVYPHDSSMFLQCPYPTRCVALTCTGGQCSRRAVWAHHRVVWCSQHAPSYLKESRRA